MTTVDLKSLATASVEKPNKRAIAERIYVEQAGKKSRKDIITMFMTEAGLTWNGASTYYQNFKKKYDELVAKKQAEGGLFDKE